MAPPANPGPPERGRLGMGPLELGPLELGEGPRGGGEGIWDVTMTRPNGGG